MGGIPVTCRGFSAADPLCLLGLAWLGPPTRPLQEQEPAADLWLLEEGDEEARDAFTAEEVFELIRNLNDPEHPLTLEQLKVATVRECGRFPRAHGTHACSYSL